MVKQTKSFGTRSKYVLGGTILVATLAAVGLLANGVASSAAPESPQPTVVPSPSSAFEGNVTLAPVQAGYQPEVSATQATAVAVGQFPDLTVQSVQAQLALFSWTAVPVDANDNPTGPPLYTNVPTWVVSVKGACSQWVPATGDCLNDTTDVVVDASAGTYIMSFAPGS